jgi:cholesterol oxidase
MSLRRGQPPRETETLVIGSGFGGSVIGARLAAAGRQVCVLERGKAYPPGAFPRSPAGVAANFWSPSDGLYGLFDAWSFSGIDSVVSSGLGGGSLIYANVLLRKDASWFAQSHPYQPGVIEHWPISYEDLRPHYEAVEQFLEVQTLPVGFGPDFDLPKTTAMQAAARGRGEFELAPLAVRFRDRDGKPAIGAELPEADYPNIHGSWRRSCRMLGECDVGCNEGAKSSLDHTYLSAASHRGAAISICTEAKTITRRADGRFDVGVLLHDPDRPAEPAQPATITALRVVLSAGTYGSTYLLLVNRERLGITTPALGTRYCGNGDLLGFWFDSDRPVQGSRGPVITSYVRYPDRVDTGQLADHGMYLEDAGYPQFAAWLAELSEAGSQFRRLAELVVRRGYARLTGRRQTKLGLDISTVLGKAAVTENALPILGMGRDIPDGTLYLRDNPSGGDPVLDTTWTIRTSQHYFDRMVRNMRELGDGLHARFDPNPSYWLSRVITVHPLGGCPMRTDVSAGVVDEFGRVDGVAGLRVCDGSVMPGPVGANPSLTIAAFANRVADDLLAEQPSSPSSSLAGIPAPARSAS